MQKASSPPFNSGGTRGAPRNKFNSDEEVGKRFNNDYYASKKSKGEYGSSSSSAREAVEGHKFGKNQTNQFENHASQMSMKRNDSDFKVLRSVPTKKATHTNNKYNSLDRGSTIIDENDVGVSPMMVKKKANVHLQPMSHKKASMMPGLGHNLKGPSDTLISHSESINLLQPP
jgi:hypothetical protein